MRKEKCNPYICGVNGFWESLKWAMESGNTDAKKIWKLFHSPDAPEQLHGCYEIDRGGRNDETDLKIRHYPYQDKEMKVVDFAHYDVLTTTDLIRLISPKYKYNSRSVYLRSLLACDSHPTFELCEGFDNIMEVFTQLPYCMTTVFPQEYSEQANIMVAEFLTKVAPSQLLVARDYKVRGWAILWRGVFNDKFWEYSLDGATALGTWCVDDTLFVDALSEIIQKNYKRWGIDLVKTSYSQGLLKALNKDLPPITEPRINYGNTTLSTRLYQDPSYRGGLPHSDVMDEVIGYKNEIYLTTSHLGHEYDWQTSFRAGSFGTWNHAVSRRCPKCREHYTDGVLCTHCLGESECCETVFGDVLTTKLRKSKYGYLPRFFWGPNGKIEPWGEYVLFAERLFLDKDELIETYMKGRTNESKR